MREVERGGVQTRSRSRTFDGVESFSTVLRAEVSAGHPGTPWRTLSRPLAKETPRQAAKGPPPASPRPDSPGDCGGIRFKPRGTDQDGQELLGWSLYRMSRPHEHAAAAEPVSDPPEDERRHYLTLKVCGADEARLGGTEAECPALLQHGTDARDNLNFQAVQNPGHAESDDDQPMKPGPRQPVHAGRD